ncbi:hypothetical protein NUW54_g12905 [Trametes sanguinea]|uniref:Uncharacterized protein n=1 Tax=Trametes sanguinea TaxID=158606 RepID=A0ACC1MTU8_9APHY|nr:hypothetical protein NUW54_g12905 [Trametes sanguinea]
MLFTDFMTEAIYVPQSAFDGLHEFLSDKQMVDAVATVGTYNLVSRFVVALNVDGKMDVPVPIPTQTGSTATGCAVCGPSCDPPDSMNDLRRGEMSYPHSAISSNAILYRTSGKKVLGLVSGALLGQERIFVTSPSLMSTVYRDAQSFDFNEIRLDIGEQVFSLPASFGRQPYMLDHIMPANACCPHRSRRALRSGSRAGHADVGRAANGDGVFHSWSLPRSDRRGPISGR